MSARAKKPAEQPLVTDWYGHDVKPMHVGAYECDMVEEVAMRWWDGKRWLVSQNGSGSCMGYDIRHQWRGRRMWVLRERNGLYLTGLRPVHTFKLDLAFARPFKTERQAQRFAARYAHLGLTAVLP